MAQIPAMIADSEMSAYNLALSGSKVVFVTEDRSPRLDTLPNKLDATVLLPPYEATANELDGNLTQAVSIYWQWLSTRECMDYINIIALALMKNIPVALYFGSELHDMQYPKMLMEFIWSRTGIKFGCGIQSGSIDDNYIPINVDSFLVSGLIDARTCLSMMPVYGGFTPQGINVLASVLRPPIQAGTTVEELNRYFMDLVIGIHEEGRYLYSPITAG